MFADRPRWLYVTLAVSVLLNLFLVGFVIGRLSFPAPRLVVDSAIVAAPGKAGMQDLPVAERLRFGWAMLGHMRELRAARANLRKARNNAEEAIVAPKYDEALVKARFADVRRAFSAQQEALHDALADALGTLSPQSRARLVNDTKEKARRRWRDRP